MPWLRLEDSFATHPKIIGLSAPAFRAHVEALCYCAKHLTDGLVPKKAQTCRKSVKDELQKAGLWVIDEVGTVVIHDYLEWNPSAASVRAKREEDLARKSVKNPGGIQTESAKNPLGRLFGIQPSRPVPEEGSKDPSVGGARERDPIWDELEAIFGHVAPKTSAHGKRNRAVKDLRLSGATPNSIRSAHRKFLQYWPSILPTDTGLAKHYPQLVNGTIHAAKPDPEKGRVAAGLPDVLGGME